MASLGKMIFGFLICGLCLVGAVMIFAQQSTTPITNMTIGNNDIYTNSSSYINQTTELVSQTTSFGTGAVVVILFVFGALIIIGSVALIAGRSKG
jgi:hypothetical protein